MYILGIETTGAFASVALMKDETIIGHTQGKDRFSHLRNLMPQIQSVTENSGLSINDIDAVAVSRGPGSFTGIRIGISSARALSQALRIPCVPVSSLEALAMRAEDFPEDILLCPVLDARRNQIYGGGYFAKGVRLEERIKAGPYMLEEFLALTREYENILLLGDGIDKYGEQIYSLRPRGTETAPEDIRYQDAASVVKLGARLFRQDGGVMYNEVSPDYMRLAEAERKLMEKQRKDR